MYASTSVVTGNPAAAVVTSAGGSRYVHLKINKKAGHCPAFREMHLSSLVMKERLEDLRERKFDTPWLFAGERGDQLSPSSSDMPL
jgi:hypothetical protein